MKWSIVVSHDSWKNIDEGTIPVYNVTYNVTCYLNKFPSYNGWFLFIVLGHSIVYFPLENLLFIYCLLISYFVIYTNAWIAVCISSKHVIKGT